MLLIDANLLPIITDKINIKKGLMMIEVQVGLSHICTLLPMTDMSSWKNTMMLPLLVVVKKEGIKFDPRRLQ